MRTVCLVHVEHKHSQLIHIVVVMVHMVCRQTARLIEEVRTGQQQAQRRSVLRFF